MVIDGYFFLCVIKAVLSGVPNHFRLMPSYIWLAATTPVFKKVQTQP